MSQNLVAKVERTIRSKLASYLAKETSLRAFWRWFIPATWNIDHEAPVRLRELVYGIKARVDDYSSGNLTEDQLRDELLPLVKSNGRGEAALPRVRKSPASSTRLRVKASRRQGGRD